MCLNDFEYSVEHSKKYATNRARVERLGFLIPATNLGEVRLRLATINDIGAEMRYLHAST